MNKAFRKGDRMDSELIQSLSEKKIVAIIRGLSEQKTDKTVEALAKGGIVFVEVTLNTDGALDMISRLRTRYDGALRIGAGTVLDLDQAREAVTAGAEYIISPNVDEKVINYGSEQGVHVWPGAMTPTEIVRAYNAGASVVKLFPFAFLGIDYLKEIRAPLNHIPMMATGGINLRNIRSVLDAGAFAAGLGSNLIDQKLIAESRFDELQQLAQAFTDEVRGIRQQ